MTDLQQFSHLVWEFRYLSMAAQTAHWRVFGPTSYSDHQLYGRVYEKLNELLDPLAEQLTRLSEMDDTVHVDPVTQAKHVYLRMMDTGPRLKSALQDPNQTAAFFYEELLKLTRHMRQIASDIAHSGELSLGLEDLLASTAGELETLVYFLERRAQLLLKPMGV